MREAALTGMTRQEVSRRLAFENGYGVGSYFQQEGRRGSDFQFIDAGGRRWKTEKYFNMLGRTLLHNNARECYLAGCAKGGSDIVTISVSGDCCDACGKYENELLSITGATPGLPTLQDAMDEGLFHPNCTHRIIAVPESIARKYYGADGIKKIEPEKPREPEKPKEPEKEKNPGPAYTDGEQKALQYAIDNIADAKKEHLLVFDPEGNLEFSETGTKRHAGYNTENVSYEGKIVVHNHPKGVFPYFSQQDLDTFYSKHVKTAAIVSDDYVVSIQADENYKHARMAIDITNGRDYAHPNIQQEINDTYRKLRRATTQSEFDELRDQYIQLKLEYQSEMARKSGFLVRWFKRKDADQYIHPATWKAVKPPEVFIPAKTKEEATAYTRKYLGDNVNWNDIPLEAVNTINQELSRLKSEFPILEGKYEIIGRNGEWKENVMAHANAEEIEFNPNFTSLENWKRTFEGYETSRKSWSERKDELDKKEKLQGLTQKEKNERKNLIYQLLFTRYNVLISPERAMQATVTHEAAHTIMYRKVYQEQAAGGYTTKRHWITHAELKIANLKIEDTTSYKLVEETFKHAVKNGDIYKISEYAQDGKDKIWEFFSESFVMYRFEKDKLPEYIIDMIERVAL